MSWEEVDVSCGFGGISEETVRFGPRQETGSSLYQVDTIACVANKTLVKGIPWVLSTACVEKMALVIQKKLLVFDDSCTEHICTFTAESFIDAIAWNDDGSFLIYADRSGCLYLSHIDSQQVLFTKQIIPQHHTDQKQSFASITLLMGNDNLYELVVVSRDGLGFRFTSVDLVSLKLAISERNLEKANQIQSMIKMTTFDTKEMHELVYAATLSRASDEKSLMLAGCGDFGLSEWAITDEDGLVIINFCQHITPGIGFKKLLVTPDEQYIVALDTTSTVSLYSRKGYICLETLEGVSVEDFILFVTNSVVTDSSKTSKSQEELKIVVLTKPKKMKKELIVLSLPNFEHVYTLKVSANAALAESPNQQETITFIEGVEAENLDDSMEAEEKLSLDVGTIRVRSLMEAIPMNRLSRLLHKKRFAEAEEFAKTFGLDIQFVYKCKSYHILEELSQWSNSDQQRVYEELIEELKNCLNKIEDMEHVVQCCLQAELPTLHATYDLLNYAREKVNFGARKFTGSSNLFQALLDGINRLVTFEVAYGADLFTGSIWTSFLSSSLMDEVIQCFTDMNISSGIIIWQRHQSEFENNFVFKKLEQILTSIPQKTQSKKIIPWLRQDFVPFVLTVLPEGQTYLADWLENTARGLEFSEKELWPNNALELAEVMYTAFSSVSQTTQERGIATPIQFATKVCKLSIPFFDNSADPNSTSVGLSSSMKKLSNLVKSLREVKSLHQEYNCKLSLDQFCSEDTKTIAFRLLNRIAAAELIPQTIKKYVKPYLSKNNLKLDQVLYEHIVDLVDMNNQLASLWEPKVIAIINEIEKKEIRCNATLKLMLKARTPWSSEVESLVAHQMKSNPDNEKLQRQYQFAALRKMMASYGIRETNLADMSRIEAIINYMFSTDNPDALKDAIKICKHFPAVTTSYVYFLRIQSWIAVNKISESCDLLRNIPLSDAIDVSELALAWVNNMISWQPTDEEDINEQILATEAVFMLVNIASRLDKKYFTETKRIAANLRNINGLQREFGVFLSLSDYEDRDHRKKLLQQHVTTPFQPSLESQSNNSRKSNASSDIRIVRFAKLLNLSDSEMNEMLFDVYKENGEVSKILGIARKITNSKKNGDTQFHCGHQHQRLLSRIASYLTVTEVFDPAFNWVENADDLHLFASQALAFCHDDNIGDNILVSKILRICSFIASQCESSDYQDDPRRIDGLIHQWFEDQYKDDSLVLSSKDVLPIVKQVFHHSISESNDTVYKFDSRRLSGKGLSCSVRKTEEDKTSISVHILEFSKSVQALVNLLHENNQQELALQILMLGVSTCAQHSANLQMGVPILLPVTKQLELENQLLEQELHTAQLILTKGDSLLSEYSMNLVKLILSHRVVDHDLTLSYLDVFSIKDGISVLQQMKTKFGTKYNRIQVIAKIGVDFCSLRCNVAAKRKFQDLRECAFWGRKLQLLRMPPTWNIYSVVDDETEKKKILEMLVQHKNIDIDAIVAYCRSFSYNEEHAILMYIECQLFPPDRVAISTDISYQEKLDECIQMYTQTPYNLSKLEILLNSTIQKISPYDYERLTYTFKKISEISEKEDIRHFAEENVHLLEMLSRYERTASEIDYNVECSMMTDELEDEQILHGKSSIVPELAKKRLPFHPIAKKGVTWQVLNPEMTSEKNVTLLKPIVNKLKFDTDQMFAKAVQNIAGKELNKSSDGRKATTFEYSSVENILNMIQNDAMMVAAAKWVAQYLPRGSEKAKVLKAIVNRAKQVVMNTSGEVQVQAKQTYNRFNDVYKRVSIEAALIDHGLTEERFFLLCNQPGKLICELYEEYGDKVRFETGKMVGAPEIHSLSKMIAAINGDIDLERVLAYLIKKWLPSIRPSSGNDEDDEIMLSEDTIKKENEKNLRRVIYVLASSYNSKTIKVLLNSVYQETADQTVSNVCKIRALQVLFTLVDSQVIQKESQLGVALIHEKLLSCIYLSELESLHVSHSEGAFQKANKEGLVKGLWRNHSHEPRGIRLISDICLDYKIFDPQLWNSLLLKLLSFDMISYLTQVLVYLSGIPQLREIPSLTKIWRAVVIAPFIAVSCPLSPEEEESCLQAAQLLTRCPVILDIGLPEIASLMKKAGLYTNAIFCMKLIPDTNTKKESIQALLDDVGIDCMLSKVKKCRDQGIMDAHLNQIEEEVFNYVNEHNLFVSLFGTAYFDSLVGFLVRSKKLNKLLMKTITAGRINNALDLVKLFMSVHSKSDLVQIVTAKKMDIRHAFLMYLQKENLLTEAKPYLTSLLNADVSVADSDVFPNDSTVNQADFQFMNGHQSY